MNDLIASIVDPNPNSCPRCGGMGSLPTHLCRGNFEADAEYVKGKLVWTFMKKGKPLSAKAVERDRIKRQLRRTRKAIREAEPLWALKKKLMKKLKALR